MSSTEPHTTSTHSTHKDGQWARQHVFLTAVIILVITVALFALGFLGLVTIWAKRTPDRPSTAPNPHSLTVDFSAVSLPSQGTQKWG